MKLFSGRGGRGKQPPPPENKNERGQTPDDNIDAGGLPEDAAEAGIIIPEERPAGEEIQEQSEKAQDSDEVPAEAGEDVSESSGSRGGIKRLIGRLAVILVFLLIIFVGLTVVLYPYISNFVNTKNASRVVDSYSSAMKNMSKTDYTDMLEAAREYNARLSGSGATVKDAFGDALEDEDREDIYWSLLDVADHGMMGYVEINILDIKLPLYHGVSESVLAKGAGHIQGSSLPVGGESTHAVVSAHTGLPRAKLFTGVDMLKPGDTFALHVLNETLTYEVDQVLKVLPHEVEALAITRGGDYVTLVTCTPYGINTHRLLVRGTRIETPIEEVEEVHEETAAEPEEEPGWFEKTIDNIVAAFAFVIEKVAQGIVNLTERVMDLFGVEY